MRPIKSIYHRGQVTELLKVNGAYYVRIRKGINGLRMEKFSTLALASRYFDFVRG